MFTRLNKVIPLKRLSYYTNKMSMISDVEGMLVSEEIMQRKRLKSYTRTLYAYSQHSQRKMKDENVSLQNRHDEPSSTMFIP